LPQLTDVKIKSIKPSGKIERFHDKGGLYLELSVAGGKHWRWKYKFEGKEKRLSFGAWPRVSLKDARDKRDACRRTLEEGADPGQGIKQGRTKAHDPEAATFKAVAEEFVANQKNVWAESHAETVEGRLRRDVYPRIGDRPITEIEPTEILSILRKIEERRAFETASRVLGFCSQIFRYGVAIGAVKSDPCRDLKGALVPYQKGQHAALTDPDEVGMLMVAIDEYKGTGIVRAALSFSALTFCRPGEIRRAEWIEIDLDKEMWTIPPEKIKTRIEHKVPLSRQAIFILKDIHQYTGKGTYVFPSVRSGRPISENTVNMAIRNMGYAKDRMTAHGFRAMASTLLNETGHKHDVIEAQLAHKGADKIRAVYNRAQYMDDRRKLMQAWADYLDALKASALNGLSGN